MSLNVLIIPEDPTWNGYILRPVVERVFREIGKSNARITVLSNPHMNGIDHAIQVLKSDEFHVRYKHMDVWLFLPDADRMPKTRADSLSEHLLAKGIPFLCCAAQPEVEIWLLAGHRNRLSQPWADVRSHHMLKEEVFGPFLLEFGNPRAAGAGRTELIQSTLSNYQGLKTVCPEIGDMEAELRTMLSPV